jgi:hypothetical protein
MSPVFKGGLRVMAGSHGTVWYGDTCNENGEDFADELQNSAKVKYAWRDGCYDWYEYQDLHVVSMGNSGSDAQNTLDNIKWLNYPSFTRRRDSAVTDWRGAAWTDY